MTNAVGFETENKTYSFDGGVWVRLNGKPCIRYNDGETWNVYQVCRKVVKHFEETEEGMVMIEQIKGLKETF